MHVFWTGMAKSQGFTKYEGTLRSNLYGLAGDFVDRLYKYLYFFFKKKKRKTSMMCTNCSTSMFTLQRQTTHVEYVILGSGELAKGILGLMRKCGTSESKPTSKVRPILGFIPIKKEHQYWDR
jgi:hypothetical protein